MLAALTLASLLSLGSCSGCAVEGRNVKLCETHVAEERAALARENKLLQSKDAALRMKAADALAALTDAHANAPSPNVAKAIASLLDDDSCEVRTHATNLLGPPQNSFASLELLAKALAASKKERSTVGAEWDSLYAKLEGKLSDSKRAELNSAFKACSERATALGRWQRTLVERLALFPDDAAVDAILANTGRNLVLGGEELLVKMGNRKAVRALIESFTNSDQNLASEEKKLAETRAKPLKTLADGLKELAFDNIRKADAEARSKLAACFAERGLTPPDPAADSAVWKKWIEQNVDSFPERLPGLTSPAW